MRRHGINVPGDSRDQTMTIRDVIWYSRRRRRVRVGVVTAHCRQIMRIRRQKATKPRWRNRNHAVYSGHDTTNKQGKALPNIQARLPQVRRVVTNDKRPTRRRSGAWRMGLWYILRVAPESIPYQVSQINVAFFSATIERRAPRFWPGTRGGSHVHGGAFCRSTTS